MVTFFIISLSNEQLLKMGPMIFMKILSMQTLAQASWFSNCDFEGTVNMTTIWQVILSLMQFRRSHGCDQDAGYQVLWLDYNHILTPKLRGFQWLQAIEKAGKTPIGVYTHESWDQAPIVIKEVNGIKIALLPYSTVLMALEQYTSQEDYNRYLSWLEWR